MPQATPQTLHPINNPLTHAAGRRKIGRIKFIDIVPPIESEITDDKSVQKTFERFPLIPYSGNDKITSQRMVNLLYGMKNMSETFGGVLSVKKAYAIGDKVNIGRQRDLMFNIGDDQELPLSEQIAFAEMIRKNFIFSPGSIKKLSDCVSDSYSSTGMAGLYVVVTPYLGITKITIKYEHPTDYVFYKNAEWGTEVALSKCWDDTYLTKFPPNLVPVYPLERIDLDGSIHSFFFIKNGGFLYGRPADMAAIHDKYNEYKTKQFVSKLVKKAFVPDMIVEYEDGQINGGLLDDDKARALGYVNAGDRINDRLTNDGDDPQGIYVTTRPTGARPMAVHEVARFKSAKDINEILKEAKESIMQANNVPEILYKLSGATGFSNSVFMDAFNIYNATFNREHQTMLETLLNETINFGCSKLNIDNQNGIRLVSPLQTMLDEYNNSKSGSETQPIGTKPEIKT